MEKRHFCVGDGIHFCVGDGMEIGELLILFSELLSWVFIFI
jgi:cytochrome P450